MYKALFSFTLFLGVAFPATAFGQANPPAVPDNAGPRDNNIKMRSAELDRVEREGRKSSTRPEVKTGKTLESVAVLVAWLVALGILGLVVRQLR